MAADPALLTARNILVVAPHPDDESLGCGGLIASLAAQDRSFHTVFVTDGGASHRGSQTWPRTRLAARREQEAADALDRLGIGDQPRTFLRLRDAAMPPVASTEWQAALGETTAILKTFGPDLILLPWRRDPHCDHRASWRLVMDAVSQSATRPAMLEYAIWLDELGQAEDFPHADEAEPVAFDVSSAVASKRAAIAAHLSQTSNLINDDPAAFRLTAATLTRLTGPSETYWRPIDAAH